MDISGIPTRKKIFVLAAFSIAMGFLEAAVVVYLRQLYYPDGFSFPLRVMALETISMESLRELSTMVMLICVAILAGRTFSERLAWGLCCFGIWDIFYYAWLKVLLDWPSSLMTWDILFLIPIVWAGPVLAPVICSLTMVAIAAIILVRQHDGHPLVINAVEWILLSLGAIIIVAAFVWEYAGLIVRGGFLGHFTSLGRDPAFQNAIASHVPDSFNWPLYIFGEGLVVFFAIALWRRQEN